MAISWDEFDRPFIELTPKERVALDKPFYEKGLQLMEETLIILEKELGLCFRNFKKYNLKKMDGQYNVSIELKKTKVGNSIVGIKDSKEYAVYFHIEKWNTIRYTPLSGKDDEAEYKYERLCDHPDEMQRFHLDDFINLVKEINKKEDWMGDPVFKYPIIDNRKPRLPSGKLYPIKRKK